MKLPLLLCLLLAAAPLPGRAGINQCVDADGTTRFTDRPCDDSRGLLSIPSHHTDDPADARRDKTRKLLNALRQERKKEQTRIAREREQQQRRASQCASARDRLAYLESVGTLYERDAAGERVVLSDEQRAQVTGQAQRRVEQFCDPG